MNYTLDIEDYLEKTYEEVLSLKNKGRTSPIESKEKTLSAVGYDSDGLPIAFFYRCTKEKCNCVGSWWNGNPNQSVKDIDL